MNDTRHPQSELSTDAEKMTDAKRKEILSRPRVKAAITDALKRDRQRKQSSRKKWWRDNWIALLAMIFALIAAIPVIIQGIAAILELLG